MFINTDSSIIKGRVDSSLAEVLKQILNKRNMTQQDLIDMLVKDFVLQNLGLIVVSDVKGSK